MKFRLPFYWNYSTLDSHTNTVISRAFAYSSRWRRKPWQGLLLLILLVVSKGYICEKVSAVRINLEPTLESLIHRLYRDVLVWQCIVDSFAFLLRAHTSKQTTKKVLDLATHAWLALVPHGGANLILTMVRRACRTQYNYMFIVRSGRCGIKCHKHADISLVCCYECYRNMEASLALWYIGPGVSCQPQVPYFVTFFPVCLFLLFCAIFYIYIYITLHILINPSYNQRTSFAVELRHPRPWK